MFSIRKIKMCVCIGFILPIVVPHALSKDQPIVYQLATGVGGNLNSIGSDTLNNLMSLWGEGFKKLYPNVLVQIEGKGSSTAPPALIAGTAQLAPMSRPMTNKEIETFERKYGFKPTKYATAVDSLAVYVHKDNPLQHLTLPQVDAIFSRTRNGNYPSDITTWGQLGLKGKWAKKPLSLYGRNSASGTYGFFKKKALFKGDFKEIVKEQPGSASVVNGVGKDLYAIGYSGIGYRTGDVRALPLKKTAKQQAVAPTFANVLNKTYPLGRALYVYVVQHPSKPMSKLIKEFLKYVLSDEGQRIVSKDGYGKLPYSLRMQQLAKLK